MELDRTERRVLGALMEKRWAVPDQYPLTVNALLAACNQRSNREPVLSLEGFEVEGTLLSLLGKGLALKREREGGRTVRYAERLTEHLALDRTASAVVAELMLRGPQTAPELARRIPRMAPDAEPAAVEAALADLASTRLVRLLPRAAGQRHARYAHLLAPEGEASPEPVEDRDPAPPATAGTSLRDEVAGLRERLERLERRVGALLQEGDQPASPPG